MTEESDGDLTLVDEVVADLDREFPQMDSAAIETVCRLIYTGRKMEQRAARVMKPFGLNYTDLDVLGTLRQRGKPFELTPGALLRAVMITSGAMTTCLGRLEKAGLVKRRVDSADRRVRIVRLTRKGQRLIERVLEIRYGDAAQFLKKLAKADVRRLNQLLCAVVVADDEVATPSSS